MKATRRLLRGHRPRRRSCTTKTSITTTAIPSRRERPGVAGSYELTDVLVGQTINAWDYVVDIPGHFFWDGWPQNLTLTENPSDNVINLFYFKLWNNEYTVNYYLMENADLTADNWKDALAPR